MGRLLAFELRKIGKTPFFPLALLLAVELLLSCGLGEYLESQETLRQLTGEQGTGFWQAASLARRNTRLTGERYALLGGLSQEERETFFQAMEQQYGEDIWQEGSAALLNPTPAMLEVPGYFPDCSDLDAILTWQDLAGRNQQLEEQLSRVLRAAASFLEEEEEAGNGYGIRRNRQILALYEQPRGEITGAVVGWDSWLRDTSAMLLASLWILLTAAGSVSAERDRQTWLLLHTAPWGRGKTLVAKWLANLALAAAAVLLLRGAQLGGVWFRGGLAGAGQPAASLEELALCPFPFSLWQYALVTLGLQVFAAWVLATMFTALSGVSRSGLAAYGTSALLLGLFWLPVYLPPQSLWLAGPLSLAKPEQYFSGYVTANAAGFPVLWGVLQPALWAVLAGAGLLLAGKLHCRERRAL